MTIEELSARVERVEQANRRLRAGGIAALVLVAAGAAMGQEPPPPKVIQAEKFEVIDGSGKARASLAANGNGSCSLGLLDTEGVARAGLIVERDGSSRLQLADRKGQNRVWCGANQDGSSGILLYDEEFKKCGQFTVDPKRFTVLMLTGSEEKPRCCLGMLPEGSAALSFYAKGRVNCISLGMKADESGELMLADKDGKVVFRAPEK